jgi:hypothetical protein
LKKAETEKIQSNQFRVKIVIWRRIFIGGKSELWINEAGQKLNSKITVIRNYILPLKKINNELILVQDGPTSYTTRYTKINLLI